MDRARTEALVIDALYDGAADPTKIGLALERFATHAGASGALFLIGGGGPDEPVEGVWGYGFPDDSEAVYMDGYVEQDLPRLRVYDCAPDHWFDAARIVSSDEVRRSPFYQEFLPRIRTVAIAGARIRSRGGCQMVFGLHRQARQGGFEPSDLALYDRLTLHLKRFARLRRITSGVVSGAALLFEALNRFRSAIVIIGQGGRIEVHNDAAERIFGQNDGITARNGGVILDDAGADHRFRQALSTLLGPDRTGRDGSDDFVVPRPSGRAAYQLTMLPLNPGTVYSRMTGAPKAMVVVVDPGATAVSPSIVRSLFGLSRAEARLVGCLAEGLSLEQIAERHKVARSTLKTQLLAAFSKTGTSRQSELIRLMLSLPAMHLSGNEGADPVAGHPARETSGAV